MGDHVEQVRPLDASMGEEWSRRTREPHLRSVSASRHRDGQRWWVGVGVMEFVRTEPLESELRRRIAEALAGVGGVTGVEEEDREVWAATGAPAGRALVEAVAQVVDDLADRTRGAF